MEHKIIIINRISLRFASSTAGTTQQVYYPAA
ncbi:hypothetical protein COLO4_00167 [Corchorus olitorius]|uniref:Uncharacterized protein n=1 Tax=Corchorus olitorius TaxID=93759 RepID=A0A1R3L4G9_9ROSI|nr:hypothetical protein COLO4_00167 [Corchorus olitorius]